MSSRPDPQRRAVTLIEVLVASAVTVILLGAIFGLLTSTRQAVDREQRRLAMLAYARAIQAEAAAALAGAVNPSYLDDGASSSTLEFQADRLAILTASESKAEGDFMIARLRSEDGNVLRSVETLDAQLNSGPTREVEDQALGADSRGEFRASLRFEYADEFRDSDLAPAYRPAMTPGQYPKLVRIHVKVLDPDTEIHQTLELHTTLGLL